jgi:superfamily II DNA or RNA helicase
MNTWHSTNEFWKGPNQFPDAGKMRELSEQGIIQIDVLDSIKCRVTSAQWPPIARLLTYSEMVYIRKKNSANRASSTGTKKIVQKQLVLYRQNNFVYFLSGHLPRIKAHFPNIIIRYNKNTANVINIPHYKSSIEKISLIGLSPREDQLEAVQQVEDHNRGIIVAPTGTGKTVIISSLIQKYNKLNIIVCAHTVDLVSQMVESIEKYTGKKCEVLHGTKKPNWNKLESEEGNVLVTTIQSFNKQILIDYSYLFDVVLVDECHHVNDLNSNYGKMLQTMPGPIRVGFTATLPTEQKDKLCLEGLIGPVIYNLTLDQAKDQCLIVQPKIKLHKIPYSQKINNIRTYHQVIDEAIVRNFLLNSKIVELIKQNIVAAGNMLIFVQFIEFLY